ncbi:MAG TPA: hypothetical protein VNJ07_03265, partial [Chitinophagales bacterium]|nr:hypothetical protein [Chitinophagales bacterium]
MRFPQNALLFLAALSLLFVSSCNDFKHLSERGKLIVKTKDNMFRGVDFDMPLQEVRKIENIRPEVE